jgi:integrase
MAASFKERAARLDQLATIFPLARNDQLAELLTDDDVETLKHLFTRGMGENTLRAIASDLGYVEGWARAATGAPLPWPTPAQMLLKFIAHHLWDAELRLQDPTHGMPAGVASALRSAGLLRKEGPHAPSTVRRRLATLATLHHWRGLPNVTRNDDVKGALRLSARAAAWQPGRKSERAITREILDKLLETCQRPRLIDIRDHALLLTAFASGGRRRSEVAGLCVNQLCEEPDVRSNPQDANSPPLPCLSIKLGRTKTSRHDGTSQQAEARVYLVGRAVVSLRRWLEVAKIQQGAVFRRVNRHGQLAGAPLTPQSVNEIVKERCRLAGLDPALYSAHGLRSGYLTTAFEMGVPQPAAMAQSQHRSVQQAARYYNPANISTTTAARLAE